MKTRVEPHSLGRKPTGGCAVMRAWREETVLKEDTIFILSEASTRRSLRIERALSGRNGYDLNRHIRLLRLRKTTNLK